MRKKRDRWTKNLTSILIVVVNLISILSVKKNHFNGMIR